MTGSERGTGSPLESQRLEYANEESPEIAGSTQFAIGRISDFVDSEPRIFLIDGAEVGVYRHGDEFFAYENTCAHQGGPVCEGLLLGKVEAVLEADKTVHRERFSEAELHIICPWHGYEFAMETGACVSDRRLKLRKYQVTKSGDELYVAV
jgi:nitrite reductase/ring-hydroxylating ferredoxin subunit